MANEERFERDIVVLSDLHLGRGKNTHSGRYYALEAFFYDDDFLRFCRYLCDDAARCAGRAGWWLALTGDRWEKTGQCSGL